MRTFRDILLLAAVLVGASACAERAAEKNSDADRAVWEQRRDTAFVGSLETDPQPIPAGPNTPAAPAVLTDAPPQKRLAQMWDMANTLYINSDYAGAIAMYDSIASTGYESAKLWYNMGNAWFKEGSTGRAAVNYRRALRLDPSDPDTRYNLRVAMSYAKDRIEPLPEFFLAQWTRALRSRLSSDAWAALSLIMLGAALALTLVYLLSEKPALRKAGFYGGLAAVALTVLTIAFASAERRAFLDTSEGVVTASSVPAKSAPDRTGRDLFVLHEGTPVNVTARLGDWAEVMLADGNKGWISSGALEMVNPAGESGPKR